MTYPPPPGPQPPGGPADPTWSSGQAGGLPDPTLPMSGAPVSGEPFPSYSTDSYSGQPVQQPIQPVQPVYPQPVPPVQPGQPVGYPSPAYPGYGYPTVVAAPATNGMAIAAMVVSIMGALGLCGYGLGGYLGIVGAVLGHVAKRQIRERGESGNGMAMAGIIIGWLATAIALIATVALIALFVWAANADPTTFSSN